MKQRIININLNISKDTPAETLTELYAVLKPLQMQAEKERTVCKPLYALNEDIENLHARYEQLYKQVRNSLNLSVKQTELEEETLSRKYEFELEELSKKRKLEYDKQQVEIKAREKEQTPWRRGWWWRLLLFFPLTNRAQDIIEERAQIDADIIHSAAEKQLDEDNEKLKQSKQQKPTKRDLRQKLKAAIEAADKADVREAFTEPPTVPATSENVEQRTEPKAPAPVQIQQSTPAAAQLPGQMTLDDVQQITPAQPARRPRPPRNCRKP